MKRRRQLKGAPAKRLKASKCEEERDDKQSLASAPTRSQDELGLEEDSYVDGSDPEHLSDAVEGEGMDEGGSGKEEEDVGGKGVSPGDAEGRGGPVRGGEGRRQKIAGLYKPPTHEELQQLKETQNLFKSNLMRLQITELLAEARPKAKTSVSHKLEQLLHSLRASLLDTPPTEQVELCSSLSLLPKNVKYPLSLEPSNLKGKLQFLPPKTVKVVGSYLLGTMSKSDLNIDVVVQIPQESLQAKDLLNYRYFHKRVLYLCLLAGHLRRKRKPLGLKSVRFTWAWGDPLLPILLLLPEEKGLSKYTIRVHTSIPESYFKLSKLGPDRNNVRRGVLSDLPNLSVQSDELLEGDSPLPLPPTPHYNNALVMEMGGLERHLHVMYSATQECTALADAVVLCKVWARQRGLDQGYGGFTGFHFAMVMAMLLQQKKLNRLMSSYQVLRIVLQCLATSDWTKEGITMATPDPTLPPLASFHSSFDVVFLGPSGYLNLCGAMSREQFHWLSHEATLSMAILDDPSLNGFEALFTKPVPFALKFEALCHIAPANVFESALTDPTTKEAILLDGAAWPLPLVLRRIMPTLHRGLGRRVTLLVSKPSEAPQWLVSKAPPDPSGGHVTLGLLLDTDHAFHILEMGPPADSPEAGEFRQFWGEKSELRRFQDGSINEAVVWDVGDVGGRWRVGHPIIQHLLHRHAGIPPSCVTYSAGVLNPLLSLPEYSKTHKSGGSGEVCTGEEVTQKALEAFSELSKDLRQLKDLPLAVTSLQGSSPLFRHTEVFPPLPWNGKLSSKLQATPTEDSQSDCFYPSCDLATPPYVPAWEVVCQLEASGKWPEEVEAIAKIKTAFYIHLAKALHEKKILSSPTPNFLDILKSGYVFRLRIHHHREITLLKEGVAKATTPEVQKQRVSQLEESLVSLPLLTSTLHGVHQQHSAFGPGVRLCKRWVSSHLLANHLADEAVELMVAHLFLSPAPYTPPSSPLCVLLRFLSLLSSHDWAAEPLIVNLNSELSAADVSEIVSQFSANRPLLPPMFIATPHDRGSSHWTTPTPTNLVSIRLQLLARECLTLLSQQLLQHNIGDVDIRQNFRTPLQDYNVLIHLHKRHLPLSHQAVDTMATSPSHKPHPHLATHHYSHMPVVEFNPVQKYLRELEAAFSEFALFFYDKYGGSFIAVVWKPHAFVPQQFKVMQAHCKVRVKENRGKSKVAKKQQPSVVPDVEAITADFQLMGEGLVKSVQVLSELPTPSS